MTTQPQSGIIIIEREVSNMETMFIITLKSAIMDTLMEEGYSIAPHSIDYYIENFDVSTLTNWLTTFLKK